MVPVFQPSRELLFWYPFGYRLSLSQGGAAVPFGGVSPHPLTALSRPSS
jgi:hypothetical protein